MVIEAISAPASPSPGNGRKSSSRSALLRRWLNHSPSNPPAAATETGNLTFSLTRGGGGESGLDSGLSLQRCGGDSKDVELSLEVIDSPRGCRVQARQNHGWGTP